MRDLNKYLVFNFCTGERTEQLSDFCFQKLGFNNRITLDGPDGFHDKYLRFAKLAIESDYQYFIRNDADRLVFSGLLDFIDYFEENSDIANLTGTFFDYFIFAN